MIKTAVIGASGYIGNHLMNKYREQYPDVVGTTFSNSFNDLHPFDIRKPEISNLNLEETGHKAVIITVAKSNIAYCENNPINAYKVNVEGTIKLIKQLSKTSLKIIFLSTDYVFDGIKGNFDDKHFLGPSTNYGKHKEIIENQIKILTDNFLVLRLSKIYGLEKGDNTILDEAANLLSEGMELSAATDQFFCPTLVHDLIDVVIEIQKKDLKGYLNVCSPEIWSRFKMHSKLAQSMGVDKKLVKKIKLYDFPQMVGRPLDTSMVTTILDQNIQYKFTAFEDSISKVANNYI